MQTNGVEYTLRPAAAQDFPAIRKLIRQVGINPLGLRWQRFTLAVDGDGGIIGCGQVKPHSDGSRELASIAVVSTRRREGVASAVIHHLLQQENSRLFLTCRAGLGPYYQRFGFQAASFAALSPYFRRLYRLAGSLQMLGLAPGEGFLIMVWEADRQPPAGT